MLLSRRAVCFAEIFPSPLRTLSSTFCSAVHPLRTAATQRFLINCHSRRNVNQVASIRPITSSQHARKEIVEPDRQPEIPLNENLVYEAPMSRAVRLMKAVSITSCTLTSIGMPVLCVLSDQDTSTIGKWAMCGTIMLFGLGTTSLFHYLFKPYVIRMWRANAYATTSAHGDDTVDSTVIVETLSLFAQVERHSFRLSDVSPPTLAMHPMVSFQARERHYFIHPETFNDQLLLKKLVGSQKKKSSKAIRLG